MNARTTALAIFAVFALVDIAELGVVGSDIAPPLAISIVFALLGLVTLGALRPAWRGSRPALLTAVIARVISAAMSIGAFVATAPVWIMTLSALGILGTIAGIVLLRRRPQPVEA